MSDLLQTNNYVYSLITSPTSGFGAFPSFFSGVTKTSYSNDATITGSYISITDTSSIDGIDS